MLVGTEWIIDAFGCDAEKLRDEQTLRAIFSSVVRDLDLKVINEMWHQFPAEYGLTGFALLTESHLACHTYPEYQTATFNLYCCRLRPEWHWQENLQKTLGSQSVRIQKVDRGSETKAQIAAGGDPA
jgi:S-adenosylmethionine decarboxylase